MREQEALQQMVSPSQRRAGKPRGGVIQIHLTRACDLACFGCTQGSNLRCPASFISLENFELACKSLRNYFGVTGIFGGNPSLHPEFPSICEILRKYIPKNRTGIWCNHPRGHGKIMAQTFDPGCSNLNCHLVQEAYDEFKRDWPESRPFGLDKDSRHSPPYVAMQDVFRKACNVCKGTGDLHDDDGELQNCPYCRGTGSRVDDEACWEKAANCDINKHWSAMVCEIKGELYGYFCEIAAAQAILHQNDPAWPITGIPVATNPDWWKLGMKDFANQARLHCFACGVPLRGYGALAQGGSEQKEQVSVTHADIYKPKKKDRLVQIVADINELDSHDLKFTEYLQGAAK